MPRSQEWTPQKVDLIREYLKEGREIPFIAAKFGLSIPALRMVMWKNGLRVHNHEDPNAPRKKPGTRLSISQRIMELCGLSVSDSLRPKHFSDAQLISWREGINGFKKFCLDVLQVELQIHQIEMAEKMMNNRHSVFICGRRSGKTFLCAAYGLWRSIINPSENICLVSPSYESSLIIFKQILEFIAKSEELRWDIARDTADELEFRNKSNIKSLSAQSLAIRGRENSVVILDEASSLENEGAVLAAISPTLANRKNSQLIFISTPRARQGILWDAWNNPMYAKSQYPSTANKFVDEEYLKMEKEKLAAEIFQMEYEAQWCDASSMFFPSIVINQCKEKYDFAPPTYEPYYYAGIDIGRLHDASVCVILSKSTDHFKIENIFMFNEVPFAAQVVRFKQIFEKYRIQKAVVEYNGLSMPIVEQLENEVGKHLVKRFQPTIKNKEEIYVKLLKCMEDCKITIPEHPQLIDEMRNFQFVYTPSGVKLHHASGHHDDVIDALAMAFSACVQYEYHPVMFGFNYRI